MITTERLIETANHLEALTPEYPYADLGIRCFPRHGEIVAAFRELVKLRVQRDLDHTPK